MGQGIPKSCTILSLVCVFADHTGFADGTIQFDDVGSSAPEDTSSLPDGTFGEDTMYSYCCRNDGFTRDPMRLPNDKPFVLFRHKVSRCQSVAGEYNMDSLTVVLWYVVNNVQRYLRTAWVPGLPVREAVT